MPFLESGGGHGRPVMPATLTMLDEVAICRAFRRRAGSLPVDVDRALAIRLLAQPVAWLLPRLLRLVMQRHDRPVEELAPTIRQMLLDQAYANTGGDCIDCGPTDASLDEAVALIVELLREARAVAR